MEESFPGQMFILLRVCLTDALLNGFNQHPETESFVGQLEVSFLPTDDNPKVLAEMAEELTMYQKARD